MSNTNNFPLSRISLNVMTLKVTSTHVNSVQGVPISVTGIAQVRNKFSSRKWDSFLLFLLLSLFKSLCTVFHLCLGMNYYFVMNNKNVFMLFLCCFTFFPQFVCDMCKYCITIIRIFIYRRCKKRKLRITSHICWFCQMQYLLHEEDEEAASFTLLVNQLSWVGSHVVVLGNSYQDQTMLYICVFII